MTKILTAALAFALATPLAAAPALAQPPATVQVGDLDLDSPAGKAELESRITKAAKILCRDAQSTGTNLPQVMCHRQVRSEVFARLEERQPRYGKGG